MICIIAGTQEINDPAMLDAALGASGWREEITEDVSGRAPGADMLGEDWAKMSNIPVTPMPADWGNIEAPGAVVRYRRNGAPYNLLAGHWRNAQMAAYVKDNDPDEGALLALWDGISGGTKGMIKEAHKHGLRVYVYTTEAFFRHQRARAFLEDRPKRGHPWTGKRYEYDTDAPQAAQGEVR